MEILINSLIYFYLQKMKDAVDRIDMYYALNLE
jgi:hypothetical protein